jgi:membrane protein
MPGPMTESKLTTEEQVVTIWNLGGLSIRQLTRRVVSGINNDNLLGRASELAYNLILAMFPMLIFLLSLLGIFAAKATVLRADLLGYVSQVLPPAASQLIHRTLTEVMQNASNSKLTFGIVLTAWFASGGMSSMISGLNGAYELRESRSWIKVRVLAFLLTISISILVLLALGAVLTGGYLADAVGARYGLHAVVIGAWRVGQWLLAIAFVTFSFSIIYYFAPDLEEQHWYWITPGSVVGVLVWIAISFGFRAYLHFFNTYGKTYGSLGAVMILLMWLYVTGLSFLLGGEINAQIEHAAARRGHPEAKAPGEKKAA